MITLFKRYMSIGIINTAIHWVVFFIALNALHTGQALANFCAFCVAVTFSFFANARWTFNSEATTIRYILYVFFMGALASAIGWAGDKTDMNPIVTIIAFSAISLLCGFLYSRFIVFTEQ